MGDPLRSERDQTLGRAASSEAPLPSRIVRFVLWVESFGWPLNLALALLTALSTTIVGGAFLFLEGDEGLVVGGLRLLFTRPSVLLRVGVPYGLSVMAILAAHEMGHYLACRYYRVDATLPFFIPFPSVFGTLGAVIRIKAPMRTRKVLFDIGIAGPIAGFVVTLPILVAGLASAEIARAGPGWFFSDPLLSTFLSQLVRGPLPAGSEMQLNPFLMAAWFGMLITAMNLLPAGQLDGGHVCYALSARLHRLASRATVLTLMILLIYGTVMYFSPVWIAWVIVLALMGPRHPPLVDEREDLPRSRRVLAVAGLLMLILCFTVVPIYLRLA